jgi:hypothetical protein
VLQARVALRLSSTARNNKPQGTVSCWVEAATERHAVRLGLRAHARHWSVQGACMESNFIKSEGMCHIILQHTTSGGPENTLASTKYASSQRGNIKLPRAGERRGEPENSLQGPREFSGELRVDVASVRSSTVLLLLFTTILLSYCRRRSFSSSHLVSSFHMPM